MADFLVTVNGFDLLLTLFGVSGWVAYAVARPPRPRRVRLDRPYDWQKDGL